MISPFLRFLLQLGFGLCTFGGASGLVALGAHWKELDESQVSLAWVFCILLASLIVVGIIGIVHVQRVSRDLSADAHLTQLVADKPLNNVFAGLLMLALAVGLTVLSVNMIWYGAMIVGSMQAMFGASQMAMQKKRQRRDACPQTGVGR